MPTPEDIAAAGFQVTAANADGTKDLFNHATGTVQRGVDDATLQRMITAQSSGVPGREPFNVMAAGIGGRSPGGQQSLAPGSASISRSPLAKLLRGATPAPRAAERGITQDDPVVLPDGTVDFKQIAPDEGGLVRASDTGARSGDPRGDELVTFGGGTSLGSRTTTSTKSNADIRQQLEDIQSGASEQAAAFESRAKLQGRLAQEKGQLKEQQNMEEQAFIDQKKSRQSQIEAEVNRKMRDLEKINDAFLTKEIDPNRAWGSRSTAGKMSGAIGVFFGSIAQGTNVFTGGNLGNAALGMIEKVIDDDIRSQVASLNSQQQAVGRKADLLRLTRSMFSEEQQAQDAVRVMERNLAIQQIETLALESADEDIQLKAQEGLAVLKQKNADAVAKMKIAVAGQTSTTSTFVTQPKVTLRRSDVQLKQEGAPQYKGQLYIPGVGQARTQKEAISARDGRALRNTQKTLIAGVIRARKAVGKDVFDAFLPGNPRHESLKSAYQALLENTRLLSKVGANFSENEQKMIEGQIGSGNVGGLMAFMRGTNLVSITTMQERNNHHLRPDVISSAFGLTPAWGVPGFEQPGGASDGPTTGTSTNFAPLQVE